VFRTDCPLRHCILLAVVVCLGSVPHHTAAQSAGHISVFSDSSASTCTLIDAAPALFNVYIVHSDMANPWGIIGSRFKVVMGPGFTASYVSELIVGQGHAGSVLTGITIAYDACSFGTLLLATVSFQGYGTSSVCSYLDVGPDPAFGGDIPIAQDCFLDLHPVPSTGPLYVNPDVGQCQPGCLVAIQAMTWGGIKALYRD